MEATEIITKKVTLVMSAEEAKWLRSNMQNPLHGLPVGNESNEEKGMRHLFFNALNGMNNGGGG